MGTNVKRRLNKTAGIGVALTAAALSLVMASPANANEASASPEPTASAEPTATASPEPSATTTPKPTASTEPSTTASPVPTGTPSTPSPTPGCTDGSVTITGRVWNDVNENGIQDANEPGLPNIPLMAHDDIDVETAKEARGSRGPALRKSLAKFKAKGVSPKDDDEFPGVFTDAAGKYTITGLTTGAIMVALIPVTVVNDEQVDEWKLTLFEQGGNRALDSDFFSEDGWGWSFLETTKPCERLVIDGGLYHDDEPTPTASVTPAPGTGGGSLPNTGLAIGGFLLAGVVLIGGGTALTIVARRRRQVIA